VNRMVAVRSLEKLGCEVVVATNGLHALESFIADLGFDLVLMDVQMPVMDGIEATRRIRLAENGASHVPVIALTALDFPETRRRCVAAGMDGFAPKPLGFNTFKMLLSEYAGGAALQSASSVPEVGLAIEPPTVAPLVF